MAKMKLMEYHDGQISIVICKAFLQIGAMVYPFLQQYGDMQKHEK
jgi:hypothetical protein